MNPFAPFRNAHRYEAQIRLPNQRMCGAAALVMVYRQFQIEVDQTELWEAVSHEYQNKRRAHTYDLAQDALNRGLSAVIVQSHQPWAILRNCWRNNIAVVINHRIDMDSHEGHYSLLTGIRQDSISLHDPLLGPNVERSRDDFLRLWMPAGEPCEIAGNVLIAISKPEDQPQIWSHCNQPFEDSIECPSCCNSINLKPAIALGCTKVSCRERLWYRIFCPRCDHAIIRLAE